MKAKRIPVLWRRTKPRRCAPTLNVAAVRVTQTAHHGARSLYSRRLTFHTFPSLVMRSRRSLRKSRKTKRPRAEATFHSGLPRRFRHRLRPKLLRQPLRSHRRLLRQRVPSRARSCLPSGRRHPLYRRHLRLHRVLRPRRWSPRLRWALPLPHGPQWPWCRRQLPQLCRPRP